MRPSRWCELSLQSNAEPQNAGKGTLESVHVCIRRGTHQTVGETSYYLRLNYLSDIFSNQVPFLNLTPTQTSIMNKFFSYFNQTIAKFQSEVNHVSDYIQDSYIAAAAQYSNVANAASFQFGNIAYNISVLGNVTANIL